MSVTALSSRRSLRSRQRGVSLIVVMIILVIVTVLGIAGARIALLGERSTRYDRDYQIAWESAEAALIDAEYDIGGQGYVNTSANQRVNVFDVNSIAAFPASACGTNEDTSRGLCAPSTTATPVWQSIDFVNETASSPFTVFGRRTGRTFQTGQGIQPAHLPHYIIEWAENLGPGRSAAGGQASTGTSASDIKYIYRITAIGFGPNEQTQVMMQSSFFKRP